MKLLTFDANEHTVTFELDNGLTFTAVAVHEDIISEIKKEQEEPILSEPKPKAVSAGSLSEFI